MKLIVLSLIYCLGVYAFVDPISLSAVGVVVLKYYGVKLAAQLTAAAIGGLTAPAVLSFINGKRAEVSLPELESPENSILLCRTDYTNAKNDKIKNQFCNQFVTGHKSCGIASGPISPHSPHNVKLHYQYAILSSFSEVKKVTNNYSKECTVVQPTISGWVDHLDNFSECKERFDLYK